MSHDVRWITPPYRTELVPAWQSPDGGWLVPAGVKLVPAGTTTHTLIEQAAPAADLAALRARAVAALRDLQHVEAADGYATVADGVAGLMTDLTTALADAAECPQRGEPGHCEIAPCGDPGCDARDCESHETCERPTTPETPGTYLPLLHPTD